MDINETLRKIKNEFENAITTKMFNGKKYKTGSKAKEALIRSQKIINYIHELIKKEFIDCKISEDLIYPKVGSGKNEIKIEGFLKAKKQDISIIPKGVFINKKITKNNEKILAVNIRSQLSSLKKNIDTLYERTFAEALNLHLECLNQCLGEVYLIPTCEYDDKKMKNNKIAFKTRTDIENYIKLFQAINNRKSIANQEYKYERICLLIVNFNQEQPKLYNSIEMLKEDGLIDSNSGLNMDNLSIDNFASDLLGIYKERFGDKELDNLKIKTT